MRRGDKGVGSGGNPQGRSHVYAYMLEDVLMHQIVNMESFDDTFLICVYLNRVVRWNASVWRVLC